MPQITASCQSRCFEQVDELSWSSWLTAGLGAGPCAALNYSLPTRRLQAISVRGVKALVAFVASAAVTHKQTSTVLRLCAPSCPCCSGIGDRSPADTVGGFTFVNFLTAVLGLKVIFGIFEGERVRRFEIVPHPVIPMQSGGGGGQSPTGGIGKGKAGSTPTSMHMICPTGPKM